jgi:hypothetical protein
MILVLVWICGVLAIDDLRARGEASFYVESAQHWEEEAKSAASWAETVETEAEQIVSRMRMEKQVQDEPK